VGRRPGSANQTLVNKEAIDERMLNPGDRVEVGQTTLRVEHDSAATEGDSASVAQARRLPTTW
jgi:predicted lysophospholipase L1 biosynthesis ABC-type transport system permease subunit